MKAFIFGALGAVVIAVAASFVLQTENVPANQAFTAYSAELREGDLQ